VCSAIEGDRWLVEEQTASRTKENFQSADKGFEASQVIQKGLILSELPYLFGGSEICRKVE